MAARISVKTARRLGLVPDDLEPCPHKYNAQRTQYRDEWYDSKREAEHAEHLDLLIRAGVVDRWERQIPFEMRWPDGTLLCTYRADFRVYYPDGRVQLHEVKGYDTAIWKLKFRMLKIIRPEVAALVKVIR